MTLTFDTSTLSDLLSDREYAVRGFADQKFDDLSIPLATDAEIRFGFMNGRRTTDNLRIYEMFRQRFNASVTNPDQDTATIYADLATFAKQHGLALSNNDIWIAATTIQLGGVLLTSDGDFKRLPQLRAIILVPDNK